MNFAKRFELINAITTPEFNAIALAEYWDARNADFEEFMGCANQLELHVLDLEEPTAQDVEQYVDELIAENGWSGGGTFQVDSGTISIRDYLCKVGYSAALLSEQEVTPVDGLGQPRSPLTLEDVGQQAVDDWVSGVATAAFLRQLDTAKSVADRLTGFEAELKSKVSDTAQNVNATLSYYKTVLQTKPSPLEALAYVKSALSLDDQADADSPSVPENSSFADMTGASPVGPLNFDGIRNVASSVYKVGAALVSSAINAVTSGVSWLFGWVGEQFNAVFVDPIDLDSLGAANDGTVQGYCWNVPDSGDRHILVEENLPNQSAVVDQALADWNAHPYRVFKTAFGTLETNVAIQDVEFSPSGDACYINPRDGWNQSAASAVNFRPTVFNIHKLIAAMNAFESARQGLNSTPTSWTLDYEAFTACIRPLVHEGGLLDTTGLSEIDLYRSLAFSRVLFDALDILLQGQRDSVIIAVPGQDGIETVTNADFLLAASGRYINGEGEVALAESYALGVPFVMCAFIQQLMRTSNPMNWPYFAYSTSTANKPVPGWRIKTDSENQAVANNFIASAIIAAAVIAIAIYTGVKIKKFARKLAWKREKTVAAVQAKLWAGEQPTRKEMRQYERALKKGGVAGLFANAQAGVAMPDAGNSDAAINTVYKVITGESL